jgi:hypothetical protein
MLLEVGSVRQLTRSDCWCFFYDRCAIALRSLAETCNVSYSNRYQLARWYSQVYRKVWA